AIHRTSQLHVLIEMPDQEKSGLGPASEPDQRPQRLAYVRVGIRVNLFPEERIERIENYQHGLQYFDPLAEFGSVLGQAGQFVDWRDKMNQLTVAASRKESRQQGVVAIVFGAEEQDFARLVARVVRLALEGCT